MDHRRKSIAEERFQDTRDPVLVAGTLFQWLEAAEQGLRSLKDILDPQDYVKVIEAFEAAAPEGLHVPGARSLVRRLGQSGVGRAHEGRRKPVEAHEVRETPFDQKTPQRGSQDVQDVFRGVTRRLHVEDQDNESRQNRK